MIHSSWKKGDICWRIILLYAIQKEIKIKIRSLIVKFNYIFTKCCNFKINMDKAKNIYLNNIFFNSLGAISTIHQKYLQCKPCGYWKMYKIGVYSWTNVV